MNTKIYEHRDVLKVYPSLKPRTLISWSEKGLLTPVEKASGTGTRRRYSVRNLVEIGVILELVSYKIPHLFISGVMERLSRERLTPENNFDVVVVSSRSNHTMDDSGYFFDIRIGSRTDFSKDAAYLIFGEKVVKKGSITTKTTIPQVTSSILVSLKDIWGYVKTKI
jgi:DNA-binding transcriptional MerR regulator